MMVPARQRPKLLVMPAFHPGVQHCGADGYLIPHGGDDRVGVVQIRVGGGVDHDPLPCCAFYHAAAGGVLLSALAYHVKLIRDILALPVAVLKATPVASFIVLVLIWMPSGNLSVLISLIMAFPIIYTNLLEGFEHLDRKLFEMAKIFRMTFWNKMYYLYFGGLFAYFRSACAIAIGMCFKAGIAAEIIGIPKGSIGEKLYNAKIYLETPDLFAWTFVIIAVSVLFEKIFQWLLSLLAHRLSVK